MTTQTTSEDVAQRVENARKVEGRSVTWLSESTGIADKTLRRRLYGAPDKFTLAELSAIATALNCSLEYLVAGQAAVVAKVG